LDLMAFSRFVNNPRTEAAHVQRLLQRFAKHSRPGSLARAAVGARFAAASDSVVRTTPLMQPRGLNALDVIFGELKELKDVQAWLLQSGENVAVRGGVVTGKVYHRGRVVFGPAVVDAHDLESHSAVWPRIVVHREWYDATVQQLARRHMGEELPSLDEFRGLFASSGDDYPFLHYLSPQNLVRSDSFDERDLVCYADTLTSHRRLIERLAKDARPCAETLKKCAYMASYHNWCVEEYGGQTNWPSVRGSAGSLVVDTHGLPNMGRVEWSSPPPWPSSPIPLP
jgi:hypothetical protein